jgi:transposase-like protein
MAQGKEPSESATPQRWTAKRKAAVVLEIFRGKTTPAEVARQHSLTVAEVEGWMERFMAGAEEFLRAQPRELEARFEAERRELYAKIGEQALQIEALKKSPPTPLKDAPEGGS